MPPITPFSNIIQYPKPDEDETRLPPVDIDLTPDDVSFESGAKKTELPDGSVEVDLTGGKTKSGPKSDKFGANLAEDMEEAELNKISTEILDGIERDNRSRQDHLTMIAEGMKLLGLVIESNNASTASSSAPLEGMSTVRHPLLLEACQLFQANAMGELLPAAGPVKVRDDRPQEPEGMMGHNGGPPLDNPFTSPGVASSSPSGLGAPGAAAPVGAGVQPMHAGPNPQTGPMQAPQPTPGQSQPPAAPAAPSGAPAAPPMAALPAAPDPDGQSERGILAAALEKDFNHYLTTTAKEYYSDTDQMTFKIGFGGLGIKKVYNCPLERRPVSISVDVEDFIVSNALTSLSNARRITHRIKMAPDILRRMQIAGAYRDVPLGAPTGQSDQPNQVDQAKAEIAGVQAQPADPIDADFEVFECHCKLDLNEFAPKQFRDKGLALPYKVTVEKESRRILEIRRNWREDDKECIAKEYFVDFVYMRAFGFYGIGLLHLLGNTTKALTALWREFIDAGMFANFPGFLYLKGAGRQLTNQFRVAPGSGVGLDASVTDIRQAVMPLPYKSPDAAFTAFVQHVEELGQRLGGTANTPTAETRADAPVGTTLAIIEQASKPLGAVTKRLMAAQARELQLFKERFIDDPEAFWRFNKRPTMQWVKDQFVKALNDFDLVPVSDPNNPTKMHRAAKAEAYKQMVAAAPQAFDQKKAILKYSTEMDIQGVEETLSPTIGQPQQPPVDPAKIADVQHKNAKLASDQQAAQQKSQTDLQIKTMELQDAAADRQNKLQIAQLSESTERLRLASTIAIHASNMDEAQKAANIKLISDHTGKAIQNAHELDKGDQAHANAMQQGDAKHQQALEIQDQHQQPQEAAE